MMYCYYFLPKYSVGTSFGDGKKRKRDRLENNISGIFRKRRTLEPLTTWAEMQKDHSLVRNCDYGGKGGCGKG
jgi:hypothetical protein